jgi:hypothetical protein
VSSGIDSNGRTIWIADAHRDDGKRFVVHADEKLTAFVELGIGNRNSDSGELGCEAMDAALQTLQLGFLLGRASFHRVSSSTCKIRVDSENKRLARCAERALTQFRKVKYE